MLEQGSQAYSAQVSALQDNVRDLTNKNNEFVKLNASLKQKLTNKTTENEALLTDLSDVKQALKTQQLGAQQRDLESAQNIKSLSLQCEDAAFKIQSMSAQLETLQQQTKVQHVLCLYLHRHWGCVRHHCAHATSNCWVLSRTLLFYYLAHFNALCHISHTIHFVRGMYHTD